MHRSAGTSKPRSGRARATNPDTLGPPALFRAQGTSPVRFRPLSALDTRTPHSTVLIAFTSLHACKADIDYEKGSHSGPPGLDLQIPNGLSSSPILIRAFSGCLRSELKTRIIVHFSRKNAC